MGSVDIDRLIEWESDVAWNNIRVHRRLEILDACLCDMRDKFRDVTDALRRGSRVGSQARRRRTKRKRSWMGDQKAIRERLSSTHAPSKYSKDSHSSLVNKLQKLE